ncbi:MAG TPA: YeeE/YedE thiosulfate transporter family protein [Paracoccaceae bacterium]|nr:YeeE/YedE thiosulfate transporter family protein [Paracoccaceae bacterium]
MPLDWILGLIGGALIGAAAALLLLANGRIMGVSGILGGLVGPRLATDWPERALFLAGLLASAALYRLAGGQFDVTVTGSSALLVAAGLLVGIGTRMGSGCTSGHGVCGIPRLSIRSIVAVPVFMATAIATVAFLKLV